MAKAKSEETKEPTMNEVVEQNNSLSLGNTNALAHEVIADFSKVDQKFLVGLTQEYLNLEENKTYDVIFKGMSEFDGDKGTVEAVLLVGEDGMNYINGNTVLVNSCKKVTKLPCLIRIVTGDYVKSTKGTGKYLSMEVFTLSNNLEK